MKRAALLAAALLASPAAAQPVLAPVWSDHVVIQRDRPVVVEGSAAPGATLSASLGGERVAGRASGDGRFTLRFHPRAASADPIELRVSDGSGEAVVSDVLVGDVWLCSGQSNMELQVVRGLDSYNQIAASADDKLRLLLIPQHTAPGPAATFGTPVAWAKASPQTVPDFSAACFYMAQKLRRDSGVPVGAIASSWGGSQVRAWLTPEGGRVLYGAAQMALLDQSKADMPGAVAAFAPVWQDWWRKGSAGQEPWKTPATIQWSPVPRISAWNTWTGTALSVDPIGNVMLRRRIELTEAQARAGGTLNIGVVDDLDMTFVNGHPVGNTHGWSQERHYPVPPAFLKAGSNEVLVVASNSWGGGGFQSTADKLSFAVTGGSTIPLADGWSYAIGEPRDMPPRAPWDANAGIGVMHNKMIAPLGSIPLKGAAWYQGESDVGIPGYADRLRELFAGWRRQFGPLKVLVVQLPNYGPVAEKPGHSGWADLREEQRKAVVADSDAALVPALDIGDRTDLHPANKIELGRRMARAAQGEAFPMPASARREAGGVRLTFSGVTGGLHAWSGPAPLGVELCGATQESCRYAVARIDGDSLLLSDDGQPATRVRYAWAESPVVNLYDARPLPVPGFEIAVTP